MKESQCANLLWTSGQDSTFRLLELLLIQKSQVQPFYVLDRSRKSLEMEINAMEEIRTIVFKKHPYCKSLLRPTIFKELSEVKPDPVITGTYNRIHSTYPIGIQNDWLPRFANQMSLADLELCIESRVNFSNNFNHVIISNLETVNEGGFYNYKLKGTLSYPDLSLFKYFKFPLIKKTKSEMIKIAKENGFFDILNKTWFCHSPVDKKPCGICKPCRVAIGEGLWTRIPLSGLLRHVKVWRIRPLIIKDSEVGKLSGSVYSQI